MKKDWNKYKIGDILFRVKDSFNLSELEEYKRVTVRGKGVGVSMRDTAKGLNIGTKRQFRVRSNQFLISKIDAMNGAYGIIPDECDNAIITGNFWTYNFDGNVLLKEYLHYLSIACLFTDFSKRASSGTTNRKYLDEGKFYNLEIELPSLPEQKRIVKIIKSVEAKRQNINKLNKEQEREIKNILYSTYIDIIKDAEYKPMVEVAPIIRRPVNISAEEKYPELGIRCFGNGTFHKPALSGIEVGTKKLFQIKTGDLVFSNVFAWEGGIAVAKEEDNDRYGSHRFISCNCNLEQVKPLFLSFHFLAPKGLEEINNCSPGGAGRNKTLGLKKLEALKVPVPKIDKQRKFENLLNQFNQLKEQREEREKELTKLIPSLLDKAFKGEL